MAAACAALTGRTTLPGTPMTSPRHLHVLRHKRPAAIRQPSPIDDRAVQKSSRASQSGSRRPPCSRAITAPCPTDVPRPTVTSSRGRCAAQRYPARWFSPMAMRLVSARSTAPYQTLLFFQPHAARQCGVFGHKRGAVVGRGWFIVMKAILLHLRSFAHFRRYRGRRPRRPGRSRPPSVPRASTARPYNQQHRIISCLRLPEGGTACVVKMLDNTQSIICALA